MTLLALLAAATAAFLLAPHRVSAPDASRMTWVADAHQLGPVGYRDPAGALSPDGRWIAYSEGRFLRVRAAEGGPLVDLPPGDAQVRNIAWSPDNRTILADGFGTQAGWAVYDRVDGTRRPLWGDRDPLRGAKISDLRQPAWSPTAGRLPPSSTAARGLSCGPSRLTVLRRTRSAWRIASRFPPGHLAGRSPASPPQTAARG